MTGQISQFNSENASKLYQSMSLQLCNGGAEESSHHQVVVKNLTTDGVILEILHLESGLQTENLKGVEGQLKIIDQDDQVMIEIPGKILWTRNREGATGVTVGGFKPTDGTKMPPTFFRAFFIPGWPRSLNHKSTSCVTTGAPCRAAAERPTIMNSTFCRVSFLRNSISFSPKIKLLPTD